MIGLLSYEIHNHSSRFFSHSFITPYRLVSLRNLLNSFTCLSSLPPPPPCLLSSYPFPCILQTNLLFFPSLFQCFFFFNPLPTVHELPPPFCSGPIHQLNIPTPALFSLPSLVFSSLLLLSSPSRLSSFPPYSCSLLPPTSRLFLPTPALFSLPSFPPYSCSLLPPVYRLFLPTPAPFSLPFLVFSSLLLLSSPSHLVFSSLLLLSSLQNY